VGTSVRVSYYEDTLQIHQRLVARRAQPFDGLSETNVSVFLGKMVKIATEGFSTKDLPLTHQCYRRNSWEIFLARFLATEFPRVLLERGYDSNAELERWKIKILAN
jgi:hypothetical protein